MRNVPAPVAVAPHGQGRSRCDGGRPFAEGALDAKIFDLGERRRVVRQRAAARAALLASMDLREEEIGWIPRNLEQLDAVAELLEWRYGPDEAAAVACWLLKKAMGRADTTSARDRARYRRLLTGLQVPPVP